MYIESIQMSWLCFEREGSFASLVFSTLTEEIIDIYHFESEQKEDPLLPSFMLQQKTY